MVPDAFAESRNKEPAKGKVTYADAVMIFTKYSNHFAKHLSKNASLDECVAFLNGIGVFIDLNDIVQGREFRQADCARVMGQIALIRSGDAEMVLGKVKLPDEAASWEDFCLLYDIKYKKTYEIMTGKKSK